MRITKKVFLDLTIFMIGFGIFVGLIFPLFSYLIGIPAQYVSNYLFISACIFAGITVGVVNILLAKGIVGKRLNKLSTSMQYVINELQNKKEFNIEEGLDKCTLPVNSDDAIGKSAYSFNKLVKSFISTLNSETSLRKFTEIFTNELDINKLSEKALSHIMEYTGAKAGLVLINKGGEIDIASSHLIKNPEKIKDLEIVHKSFSSNKQILFDLEKIIQIEAVLIDFYPRSILIEPVSYKEEVLALIVLASTNKFEKKLINQLNVYTHGFSLGLNNAIIHEKLQQLAVLDPLTRIYNRRFGMERLREEFGKSIRSHKPLAVMMLDIDHFKDINDTYGHIVGDQVLKNLTAILKNNMRDGDIIVRYGGEEFMAILPGATKEGVKKVGEKMRRIIEENAFKYKDQEIKVTVSLGATSFPEHEVETYKELVKEADENLYHAKETGRNRVVCK
ncbi:MAG: GGDEF domain-containing protein [Candidatus Cloacimonetes bacterium]|nr:GGDEF domain-containing protein [Candidatus Cloacimonadota bacterium]MBS3767177.1 GGDEF domain-containing protein [Candidatus Cloacimonadota bacterium]